MGTFKRFDYMIPVGRACKRFRRFMGYTQENVAHDLDLTGNTISVFEQGGNNSARILLWYIKKGLTIHDIYNEMGEEPHEKETSFGQADS